MRQPFRRDDRGSAIVIVLVAVAFLTILGSLLLFTTYTGYQMKMAAREGTENFYTAETAMNEIRVGVQKAASDAIAKAYTDMLSDYNNNVADDIEQKFQQTFCSQLYQWQPDNLNTKLFNYQQLGATTYNPDVLLRFLSNRDGVTLTCKNPVVTETDTAIALTGLRVDYVDSRGYETTVATDISIGKPSFSYALSDLILSAFQDYTVIAKGTLTCKGPGPQGSDGNAIDGNAYATTINVPVGAKMIAHDDANFFVCRGNINVDGEFSAPMRSLKLWAGGIVLSGANAKLSLNNVSYVKNDLTVGGANDTVELTGQYFGFGTSASSGDESSGILINGRNASLDLSRISRLVLAGNSFVNTTGADVLMGESLSVRSNQLAYLVPFSCFSPDKAAAAQITTNPELFATEALNQTNLQAAIAGGLIDMDSVLWEQDGTAIRLSDYLDPANGIQTVFQPLPGNQTLVYFYMQFTDKTVNGVKRTAKELANEYFKAYFDHNADKLESYLSRYTSAIKLGGTLGKAASGGMIGYENGSVYYQYSAVRASLLTQMNSYTTKFSNLCATLSTEVAGSNSTDTVYDYLINEAAFDTQRGEQTSLMFYEPGSTAPLALDTEVWAVMVKGPATVDSAFLSKYPHLRILIATGSVKVTASFTGLIISGADIDIENANVTRSQTEVNAALFAELTKADGTKITLKDFMKNIGTQATGSTTILPSRDSWDLSKLVTYDNWTKN